ncbi:MAG: metal ABC transporter permease [Thermoleophilaceae bacterium]
MAVPDLLDLWQLPFARTALVELLLLSVAAGLVGAWVVLRRQAFFAHAAGAATFPGLVVAAAAGFSAPLAALGVALTYAAGVVVLGRRRPGGRVGAADRGQLATALLLVAALAGGVVLASDVFSSGAEVDRMLFGTLLGLNATDLAVAGSAATLAAVATLALGRTWAVLGFDPEATPPLPLPATVADALLLALIAAVAVAALPAVGALLTTALLVVPAATVRLFAGSIRTLLLATPLLAAAEAIAGLYLALWLDAPPGPALAVLAAATYLAATLGRAFQNAARPTGGTALPARESPLFISPVAGNAGPAGGRGDA